MSRFVWLGISCLTLLLAYLLYEDWQFFRRPRRQTRGTVFDHHRSVDDGAKVEVAYPLGHAPKARVVRWWLRPTNYAFVIGRLGVLWGLGFGYVR